MKCDVLIDCRAVNRYFNLEEEKMKMGERMTATEEAKDELMNALQKTRAEAVKRSDTVRKEHEEKIAFLLQQLRAAESRHTAVDAGGSGFVVDASVATSASNSVCGDDSRSRHARHNTHQSDPSSAQQLPSMSMMSSLPSPRAEFTKRWEAERELREQLERRNSELLRELRFLREKK